MRCMRTRTQPTGARLFVFSCFRPATRSLHHRAPVVAARIVVTWLSEAAVAQARKRVVANAIWWADEVRVIPSTAPEPELSFARVKSPALTACSVRQGEPTRKNSSFGACTFVCSGNAVRMTSARRPLVCRSLTIRRGCSASCATNLRAAAAQRASCASPCEPAACIGARSGCPQGRAPRLFS